MAKNKLGINQQPGKERDEEHAATMHALEAMHDEDAKIRRGVRKVAANEH